MDADGARDELARELAALAPRAGGAEAAVMRARDWLLGRSDRVLGRIPEELRGLVPDATAAGLQAVRDLREARGDVPEDAADDYDRLCEALRGVAAQPDAVYAEAIRNAALALTGIAPPPDVFASDEDKRIAEFVRNEALSLGDDAPPDVRVTEENVRIVAEYNAMTDGGEFATNRLEQLWRDHPQSFAKWIVETRESLGFSDAGDMLEVIRDIQNGSDDIQAAARYEVSQWGDWEIVDKVREFLRRAWADDIPEYVAEIILSERHQRQLPDAATTLRSLEIMNNWMGDSPSLSIGRDTLELHIDTKWVGYEPAGLKVAPSHLSQVAVAAVATAAWWTAYRIWKGRLGEKGRLGSPRERFADEMAQALTPLLAVIEKWRAIAESVDPEADAD